MRLSAHDADLLHPSPIHRVLNHVSIRLKLGAVAAISALVMVLLTVLPRASVTL